MIKRGRPKKTELTVTSGATSEVMRALVERLDSGVLVVFGNDDEPKKRMAFSSFASFFQDVTRVAHAAFDAVPVANRVFFEIRIIDEANISAVEAGAKNKNNADKVHG